MVLAKEETGSTNDDARELALSGAPHGTAVLARRQTAGRGRAGRAFSSPEGGLYLSVVLRPSAPPHHWSLLPLTAGAAFAAALDETGFPVDVKWPNDLLVDGRKLGGVLVESRMGASPFAVVGVGLNVTSVPRDQSHATCLALHGTPPDARALSERFVAALLERAARLDAAGPAGVLPEVRARCWTLGKHVVWEKGEGVAVDLAEDGALVVEADGVRHHVVAGDVRVRVRSV